MFLYSLVNNPAIKILFLIGFFIFFYTVMYKIGVFFGIDQIELLMYMGWVGLLMILLTFLPFRYGILDSIIKPSNVDPPLPVAPTGGTPAVPSSVVPSPAIPPPTTGH
jgi:hypothetical protein